MSVGNFEEIAKMRLFIHFFLFTPKQTNKKCVGCFPSFILQGDEKESFVHLKNSHKNNKKNKEWPCELGMKLRVRYLANTGGDPRLHTQQRKRKMGRKEERGMRGRKKRERGRWRLTALKHLAVCKALPYL